MSTKPTTTAPGLDALERAIEVCSGQSALARELERRTGKKVDQGNIWSWLNRTMRVPPEFAPHIEHICAEKGKRITREELCPDFPWGMPRAKPVSQRRAQG